MGQFHYGTGDHEWPLIEFGVKITSTNSNTFDDTDTY